MKLVGLVGWRGMVGSVLMDRMQAEGDFGLIEPLSVIQPDPKKSEFLLLDGHLRVLALKELGMETAPCLMAKDDETFSYNHRINRLSTVQEHYMLRRAIDRGVSRERLARAFNVNLSSINRRINLLEGICPEAIDLLQDKQFTPDVTRILRNMKAGLMLLLQLKDDTSSAGVALHGFAALGLPPLIYLISMQSTSEARDRALQIYVGPLLGFSAIVSVFYYFFDFTLWGMTVSVFAHPPLTIICGKLAP